MPWSTDGIPRRIGRYKVLGLLGEGGMGRVCVAEDHALKRRVAIKVLKNCGESSHRRLLREARAAARISHPNLCPVFDVGEDRQWPFIATELLSGQTLVERLERGALSREEILPLHRGRKPLHLLRGGILG
jgi:serine/threonine protein kinase